MSGVEENARLHVHSLVASGNWSLRAIADHIQQPRASIQYFMKGRSSPLVAHLVLQIKPGTLPGGPGNPWVSRVGAVRRLQALMWMGWPHSELRKRSGVRTDQVLSNDGPFITRRNHERVAEMYRQLSHQRGPSPLSTSWARKRGYAGPFQWDDIDYDEAPECEVA